MRRRTFLTSTTLAAATETGAAPARTAGGKRTPGAALLAGMTLTALRDRFRKDLFERYVPFFLAHMVDRERGGFIAYTELDGSPRPPDTRTPWWIGRGIWMVSRLYADLDKKNEYIDIGRTAADILMKNRPEGENRWPAAFDRDNKPIAAPSPDLYHDMFAAEGLAELGRATGDDRYRALSKETILKCVRFYDRPDFSYAVTYGPKNTTAIPGARILPHWMVFLNSADAMLRHAQDPEMEALARRAADAVMDGHMHPEYRLLNEVRNRDFSIPEGPFSRFSYTGHAYETLWMVMREAARRKDPTLFTRAADAFLRHVEVSWDDVYDGAFSSLEDVEANTWGLSKSAWSQVEVLTGCLVLLEHRDDPRARDMFGRMYAHFQSRYSLESKGCPIWHLGGDRKLATVRPGTGDIYHIPRWLMLSTLILDRMVARGGRVSGLV